MTREILLRRSLRGAALLIAVAGAFDPAITSNRTSRPDIAVVAIDPARDSALARRVEQQLSGSYSVIAAPFAAASATVIVGSGIPALGSTAAGPVFAVIPNRDTPPAAIDAVQAPLVAPLGGRVPVNARVGVSHRMSGAATVVLSLGTLSIDRQNSPATDTQYRLTTVPLEFAPAHPGIALLHVAATIAGQSDSTVADVAVDVRQQKWPVLFYDPRPSWMSTFVRRSIEADDRFGVSSRIVTSRGISTDAGRPAVLDDAVALDQFAAVIVGAPDALTDRDVAGLDRFLRQRGGSVVFLLDQFTPGPWQRLADAGKWIDNGSGPLVSIGQSAGQPALKGSEFAWPERLPAGATTIASSGPDSARTSRHPVIWQSPVGAGELVVSGGLDTWRYRDSSVSRFDSFWRDLIANVSASAPAAVAVDVDHTVVVPGEAVALTAVIRNAVLHSLPVSISASAAVQSESGSVIEEIDLWPGESPGELRGGFRAPTHNGSYRIVVAAAGRAASSPLVVSPGASHASRDQPELLAMWSSAHGGAAVAASKLNELPAMIRAAISPVARRERWHPMRSAWWLLLFVTVLSTEWWLRRRRGLA